MNVLEVICVLLQDTHSHSHIFLYFCLVMYQD